MGTVTILFNNGSVCHYINATCAIDLTKVVVNQFDKGDCICMIKFDKQTIKSIHYDA